MKENPKMKISWRLLTALVLIMVITANGCSVGPESATSSAGNIIKLKYADQNAPTGWEAVQAAQPWLEQIHTATAGHVQIEPYFSESLIKGASAWQAAQQDLADMAWAFHGYWENKTSLADVVSLPLMPFTSAKQASGILWQLFEKYPCLREQFKENHILLTWTSTPYFIITSRPVKTLADFKGLKIRVTNGPPVEMMHVLGATPVTIGMPDTFLYLQKGVIDGTAASWENIISWRLYEVAKYYTYIPLFVVYFSQIMNQDIWKSLPSEIQSQIDSVCGLKGSLFWGENMFDTAVVTGRDMVKKLGYEMEEYTLPEQELVQLNRIAGQPIRNAWVKKMTDAGHPEAQEILDTTLDLIKTYHP